MNKMNKIISTLIITIAVILGISTISQAKEYRVGQYVNITYEQYANSKRILCMEHGQNLMNTVSYKIVSHVKIEGNKSTDHKGKTIESWYNAKMAAILSSDRSVYTVKNAVWNFGYTWMRKVGRYHSGVKLSFASNTKGAKTKKLDKEATEYANRLKDENLQISDKTDKTKIKTVSITLENQRYTQVGPFNWKYSGDLSDVKVYDQNSKEIQGIKFGIYKGKELKWEDKQNISSEKDFYIALPVNKGVTKLSKVSASINTKIKNVDIWFLEAVNKANQNLILTQPKTKTDKINTELNYDILLQGSLKVIKVNKNNEEVKLKDVGFYIQNKNTGKYVKQDDNKQVTYVDNKSNATEFITDVNGEILVENLMLGTYVAYETKNPNYGYIINQEGHEKEVVIDKTEELKIPNEQQLVKLSGYVWQDKTDGKTSVRNNLYKNGEQDTHDILVEGIIVRLKDKNGNTIKETKTDSNGAYLFEEVAVASLADYYIEFEYDGLSYEPVTANLDKESGSKALENAQTRTNFNNNFAVIEGSGEGKGFTRDVSGNKVYELSYTKDKTKHTSTLVKDSNTFKMVATTTEAGYLIKDHYTGKEEEIKNINLGIYEREQSDLAIMKDVQNAKITINGYEHTYQYAKRILNQGEYESGFNVGVKFSDEYDRTYTRAIYKSDVEYKSQDASKELKVYITYRTQVRNDSTNLVEQVNCIVDYYDARYTIKKIGTGLDENGNITGEIAFTDPVKYNDKYMKTEINVSLKMEAQETQDIYVQFELNREAVLSIMNDEATLDNVVEIASYTTYDKSGNIYAGIDSNSNPGDANPEDKTTHEDDTDTSPSLKLELANEREITGKVFLDETNSKLLTGQIREGDGEYKDGEKGIKDVEITLKDEFGNVSLVYDETAKTWVEAKGIKTDENGDFKVSGFIPGKYQITYTWGDETYTVQNYKGTIYQEKDRANHLNWYKTENPRYSDAMDDWTLRQTIDTETAKGQTNTTKMNSTTPQMEFGIEYDTTITDGTGDKVIFKVQNVDFGIVERARQQLTLDKHVKTVKMTLDNGTVLIDAVVNEEGKLEGQISGLTGGPTLEFVKAEIDNEILQKANIEIGYEIVATNNSENDYVSANGDYYFYGEKQSGNNKGELLKLQVGELKDYLDNTLTLKEGQDDIWQIDSDDTSIEGRRTYITKKLSETQLAPTEQAKVEMKVSKDLANEEEIIFENLAVVTSVKTTPGPKSDTSYGPKVTPPQDEAEPVTVTTPTGANLNYILPITIGLSTLIILGAGIWLIKKKVLNK